MPYGTRNALFQGETNRILPMFIERGRLRSWWASLGGNGLRSEIWPQEFGDTVSRNILERTIPTAGVGASWVVISQGAAANCVPSPLLVEDASNLRTTNLLGQGLDSSPICVDESVPRLNFKRDVAHKLKNLADNVADQWEYQNRFQYLANSNNHLVFNPQLPIKVPTSGFDFPSVAATSPITQRYLDSLRIILSTMRLASMAVPTARKTATTCSLSSCPRKCSRACSSLAAIPWACPTVVLGSTGIAGMLSPPSC